MDKEISCEVAKGDCTRHGGMLCGRCERARAFLEKKLGAMEISRRENLHPPGRPVYQVAGVDGGEGEKGVLTDMVLRVDDGVEVIRIGNGVITEKQRNLNLVEEVEGD